MTDATAGAPEQTVTLDLVAALCNGGECPTVFRSDSGTFVIQGFRFDPRQAGATVPAGEQMVEVPAELIAQLVRSMS